MLYDDFYHNQELMDDEFRKRFLQARPFAIEKDFFDLVDKKFLSDPKFVQFMPETFRMPYDSVFIETSLADTCALLYPLSQETHERCFPKYEYKEKSIGITLCVLNKPSLSFVVNANSIVFGISRPKMELIMCDNTKQFVKETGGDFESATKFLVTWANVLIGIICTINSPKIVEKEFIDRADCKRNKIKGAKKLHSYTRIKLSPSVKRAIDLEGQTELENKGNRKLHWRRGHFKHCRTGTFWWSAHLAGSATNGVVNSRYVAEA